MSASAMTTSFHNAKRDERLVDLLTAYATEGLSDELLAEMHQRLGSVGLFGDAAAREIESYEQAASALCLAVLDPMASEDPMPSRLIDRVSGEISRLERIGAGDGLAEGSEVLRFPGPEGVVASGPGMRLLNLAGWVAAAAGIAMAFVMAQREPLVIRDRMDEPQVAALHETLIEQAAAGGVVRAPWVGQQDSGDVGGEVLWDPGQQVGTMSFASLPVNDPQKTQYQLWIFDATRPTGEFAVPEGTPAILSQRPIDGGVFDAGPDGRTLVPIRPAIGVKKAAIFVITEEPAGGVVVSDRSRIVSIATLS